MTVKDILMVIDSLCSVLMVILPIWMSLGKNKVALATEKPSLNMANMINTSSNRISLTDGPWLTGLLLAFSIIYVLLELYSPGELTKHSVFKITIGVGFFFYVIIRATILKGFETLIRMKFTELSLYATKR